MSNKGKEYEVRCRLWEQNRRSISEIEKTCENLQNIIDSFLGSMRELLEEKSRIKDKLYYYNANSLLLTHLDYLGHLIKENE